jgi:arachidonate 5-lipoxygenase
MARKAQNTSIMLSASAEAVALPPLDSVKVQPVRPDGSGRTTFPYENLAFEGGGAKGYAYIGAVRVLEEEGVYPLNIRRVTGTSIGSMFAMFVALGVSSAYMEEKIPADIESLAKDGSGGALGGFLRAARRKGMNPGQRLYDFLGSILEEVTGSPDVTFAQLLERCGRELAVPVTNVTRMMTEFCHVKTTPNMAVRVAVRMSMSLPVLLQPISLRTLRESVAGDADAEMYVDGGLLCNNPTHVFDGWWLSTDPRDSFLRRLQPIEHASAQYPRSARFSPANPRTLGFTLFAGEETDITRSWLVAGAEPPARPDTEAAREYAQKEAVRERQNNMQRPIQRLLQKLDEHDVDNDGRISVDELRATLTDGSFSPDDARLIFGSDDIEEIFRQMNADGGDRVEFNELLSFLETRGLDVTTALVGFPSRPPKNIVEFAMNLLEAVSRDLTRSNQTSEDRPRTIPINTDYVGTTTFNLVEADLKWMIESGRVHTKAFLDSKRSS